MNHDVTNQPPPLTGTNAWRGDPLLVQLSEDFSNAVRTELDGLGRFVRTQEAQDLARLANSETPKLRTYDRQGFRLDQVEFHPAYHALMRRSVAIGLHSSIWENSDTEIGKRHQARAARYYPDVAARAGASLSHHHDQRLAGALMASPKIFREWAPRVTTRKYDHSHRPPAEKDGLTLGMGMTEKQGGTDVRANITRAERTDDGFYRINGHKWFFSAPMCDAFLVLAQAREGLSCFLVPRILSTGEANGLQLPAAEGQARQPLQRLLRGRVRRHHRRNGGRAGRRREDDHGHGDADPAGLRHRLVGDHARRTFGGRAPCPPPPRLPELPDQPAADAARAGRHGAGCRGRHRAGLPPGARLRRGRRQSRSRRRSPAP